MSECNENRVVDCPKNRISAIIMSMIMTVGLLLAFVNISPYAQAGDFKHEAALSVALDGSAKYICGYTESYGIVNPNGLSSTVGSGDMYIESRNLDDTGGLYWRAFWGDTSVDVARSIAVQGSNLYITGSGCSPAKGNSDVVILNYTTNGNLIWTVQKDVNSHDEVGWSIGVTDTGLYISGEYFNSDDQRVKLFLIRYDLDGNEVWYKEWNGDQGLGDSGPHLAISGSKIFVCYENGDNNIDVRKYDADGTLEWDNEYVYGIPEGITADDSYFYVVGEGTVNLHAWVAKFDMDGVNQWSQSWDNNNNHGTLMVSGVALTSTNVYLCGYISAGVTTDAFYLKYNLAGVKQDEQKYNSGVDEYGVAIAVSGTSIYIVGALEDSDNYLSYTLNSLDLKYDLNGNIKHNGSWGDSLGDNAYSNVFFNNNIYVVGETQSYGAGGKDAVIAQYDLQGNLLWWVTWGGTADDCAYSIALSPADGNLYITGYTSSYGAGGKDIFIVCVNTMGTILSYQTWGTPLDDIGYSIAFSGPLMYIAGSMQLPGPNTDAVILEYAFGNLQASATWGGIALDCAHSITVTDAVYICGETFSFGNGNADMFVQKYDYALTPLWTQFSGTQWFDAGYSIAESGGFLYIAGCISTGTQVRKEAYIWRYNTAGVYQNFDQYGGNLDDCAYALTIAWDSVYITGYTYSNGVGGSCSLFVLKDSLILGRQTTYTWSAYVNPFWPPNWPNLGDDFGYGICSSNQNLYVSGRTQNPSGAPPSGALTMDFNPNVVENWETYFH